MLMFRFLVLGVTLSAVQSVPAARFDPRGYGAKGDGRTDDTLAIQKASDDCNASGGGVVALAPGVYVTYTLELRSNVELRIGEGVRVRGGPDGLKYPLFATNDVWNVELSPRHNRRALFYTCGQTNVAITGRGVIDSNADAFHVRTEAPDRWTGFRWRRESDTDITGRVVFFAGCRDVRMEDVLIDRPCGWSTWFLDCDRVKVRGVRIEADPRYPNGDGIHLGGCRDVEVSECVVHSQDDSLVMRSHQEQMRVPRALERVKVSNCVLRSSAACAIRFGWTYDYAIRDISFENLVCEGSKLGISCALPQINEQENCDPPRGPGVPRPDREHRLPFSVERCSFSGLRIKSEGEPLNVFLLQQDRPASICGLSFTNCVFEAGAAPSVVSRNCDKVDGWTFKDCKFDLTYDPESGSSSGPGFPARVEHLKMDGCEWNVRRSGLIAPAAVGGACQCR